MENTFNIIKEYILSHETEIAYGINDFGELRAPFKDLIGRDAGAIDHLGRKVIDGKRVE